MASATGRVAIVTGGAQGIGRGLTQYLLRHHATGAWRVVAVDFSQEGIADCQRVLSAEFGDAAVHERVAFVHGDCSDAVVAADAVGLAVRQFGGLDLLVNNAGGGGLGKGLDEQDTSYFLSVLNSNLTATHTFSRAASEELRKHRGAIVNISSTRAFMSEPGSEPYAASKGGIVAITHALASSLAPDVTVNCVCPGWIDVSGPEWGVGRTQHPVSAEDCEQHWSGRVGHPDDVAQAVLFFADAKFVTGQSLNVDGGMTKKMIYAE